MLTCYTLSDDVIAQKNLYWQWVVSQWELQSTGNTQYLLYDGHGSTRQLVSGSVGSTSIVDDFSYDAYGVLLQDETVASQRPGHVSSQATSLLYTGEQFDSDAQQYYNRARWYDPLNGRFNRTDPFFGNLQDPQSLHKYLYCHANPVNNIDPSGKFYSASDVTVTMGIRISIQVLIITVGAIIAWKKFGPKGHKPDANQQRQINAANLVIQNNLLNKRFILDSDQEIVIDYKYVDFDKYYVANLGNSYAGEHRPWPFEKIILDEKVWFAMSPELGACTMVHELYHYFHWGFGTIEEKAAHELEAQVYIELGLPRSGSYWDDIVEASQNYDFPLPE